MKTQLCLNGNNTYIQKFKNVALKARNNNENNNQVKE